MSSLDKLLSVLDLFTDTRTAINSDDVQRLTKASRATAYRYLQALSNAGLLAAPSGGMYRLGSRIIQLDRTQRLGDMLLAASQAIMQEFSKTYSLNIILSDYYADKVLCSYVTWPDKRLEMTYERGRPMPLFRGAMAKTILANLSPYQLRKLMLMHVDEIRAAGLGNDWPEFRSNMARLRREVSCVTRNELTPHSLGVGAPLFDAEGKIAGSIVFAVPNEDFERIGEAVLRERILRLAERICDNLRRLAPPTPPDAGRHREAEPGVPGAAEPRGAKAGAVRSPKAAGSGRSARARSSELPPAQAAKAPDGAADRAGRAARAKASPPALPSASAAPARRARSRPMAAEGEAGAGRAGGIAPDSGSEPNAGPGAAGSGGAASSSKAGRRRG